MHLESVARRSVADDVFDQLAHHVVSGDVVAGETLPSERHLAEALGVSRPAVREALQRLAHAGLVQVRQGESTRALDYRRTAGLDLLPRLLVGSGGLDVQVARSVMEARATIGPKAAALAATRATPAQTRAVQDAALAVSRAPEHELARPALAFWDAVVNAADSITFSLMFNGLRAAYDPVIDELSAVLLPEFADAQRYAAIADAIARGDAEAAQSRSDELLALGERAFITALEG